MISRAKGIDSVGEVGVRVYGAGGWVMGYGDGRRRRSGVRAFRFLSGGVLRLHAMIRWGQ